MQKQVIKVPKGIRFLSKWPEFKLSNFPAKGILNKQIPGCGFTEYCINGSENVILCSPRKMLLNNKFGQHEKDVYLVVNEMDNDPFVDKDISKDSKDFGRSIFAKPLPTPTAEEIRERNAAIYSRIKDELTLYYNQRIYNGLPVKILVTYDSYRVVKDILEKMERFQDFYTIVDEFQSILHDARFKSDTELTFLQQLKQSHSALFVSATPMMEEYLDMLAEFKDLPYYELDWISEDPGRTNKPSLKILTMKSVGTKAAEIVGKYLDGNFDRVVVVRDGQPVEIVSDEAVLFVNSINHIISIIKKMKLQPDQVNILCSNTTENLKKIQKKLGKKWTIGEVPKKKEKPKMFTFCTRTVYLGADFYSTCAQSFIFSDSNIDSLSVDISEDLPQILGRQRLEENPWTNSATFYYRTTCDYRKVPAEGFNRIIENKKKESADLLTAYGDSRDNSVKHSLAKNYKVVAQARNYKDNYIAVNRVINSTTGDIILLPVVNNLVLVNEIRAFRIQQIDYKDRFTVFSTIHNTLTADDTVNQEVTDFLEKYCTLTTMYDKMRYLCEYGLSEESIKVILGQISDSDEIKSYYVALGPKKLYSLGYNVTKIKKSLGIALFPKDELKNVIYSEFNEGDRYTLNNLKKKLGDIYSNLSYKATPRALDILNYFDVKEFMITEYLSNGSKKRSKGYELLKRKQ